MVKARGPSKGANWIASERGLVRPRFTTSCSKLFTERGNPWLTSREQVDDFPLSRSRAADTPLTAEQIRRAEIYENARSRLEKAGIEVPKPISAPIRPSFVVDPDMDMYTKADRAQSREPYVDPVGKPVIRNHARWRANLLRKTRLAMAAVSIEIKDKPRKKGVIKGRFYVFDAPVKKEK